jgi:hypothetical protein
MNKKVISILSLLIILLSLILVYRFYNEVSDDGDQYTLPDETIDEDNITEEIDNIFLEEDDEIEIGDMV